MKEGDVVIVPLPQADGSVKNRPAIILREMPPFARERLYTSPMPTKPGDLKMDCHWTALNFFNETPDARLSAIPCR